MSAGKSSLSRKHIAVTLLAAALTLSPFLTPRNAEAEPLAVHGAGATFPAPLYKAWFDGSAEIGKGVIFSYDVVGSGEGIKRFVAHTVDFAASDRVLTAEQAGKVKDGAIRVPATAGMVVLAYNLRGLEGGLRMSRAAYIGIFSGYHHPLERSRDRRQQSRPDLAGARYCTRDAARCERHHRRVPRHLAAVDPTWQGGVGTRVAWPPRSMQAAGNEGVAALIKRSEGSIGYVEHGFARRLNLPVAVLENRAGQFVAPNAKSGQAGLAASVIDPEQLQQAVVDPSAPNAYPIVTYSWLFLYKTYSDPQMAGALKSFVEWGLTRGQERARAMGYVPLSAEAAALGQAALGTQFQ